MEEILDRPHYLWRQERVDEKRECVDDIVDQILDILAVVVDRPVDHAVDDHLVVDNAIDQPRLVDIGLDSHQQHHKDQTLFRLASPI